MCHGHGVELNEYPAHLDRQCVEYNGPTNYMVRPYIGEDFDRINEKPPRMTLHKLRYHVKSPPVATQNSICPYWWQGRGCTHINECAGRHPAFEDGYPLWKENLCPHFQVDRCRDGSKCKLVHMSWDDYRRFTRRQSDAWTDWMHMAAEKREKQGPVGANFPTSRPEWFAVDSNQDDLFRWRAEADARRRARDAEPFNAFNSDTDRPPGLRLRSASRGPRRDRPRSRTPSAAPERVRQASAPAEVRPPGPPPGLPPGLLTNISLHTTARKHAWKYFKLLAKRLLQPAMHPAAREDVPLIYIDVAATLLMDVWAADKSARALRCQQYLHAFTNPVFQLGEFGWLPILVTRVNKYLHAASVEGWALLDKDFTKEVDETDLVNSDLD